MQVVERLRIEAGHFWRKLTGVNKRARAAATAGFEAALRDLRPGDLAIDLGANAGIFTERMAATGADVIAFEPDPHAFALLSARVGDRPNVRLIKAGAGSEAGSFRLYRHRDFDRQPDHRSTSSSLLAAKRHMDQASAVDVEVKDFTAFLTELDRPVALLKIDIEGAEVALLERLLTSPVAARIDRIFVETHERVVLSLAARTRALKALAAARERPAINWDWH